MGSSCKFDCIVNALGRIFKWYGRFVAIHPWPFLIIPVVVCIGLTGGISQLQREDSAEIMYTPTNGEAKNERRLVQEYFPENDTHSFQASRRTGLFGYMHLVITGAAEYENVYTPESMAEIIDLDTVVKTHAVDVNGEQVTYNDICAKWNGDCSDNVLLKILEYNPDNVRNISVRHPVHGRSFIGMQLGGVILNEDGFVESAEAVLLTYNVAFQTDDEKTNGNAWLRNMTRYLLETGFDKYSLTEPNVETALSLDDELATATGGIAVFFSIAYTILMTFAAWSTWMSDWVRGKMYLALAGEVSAVLAVGASFGLLSLCGVLYTSTVGTMPFLIVGIGIDNMFVLISSWRHTNYLLPVEDRMAITFEKAAVSITLTSLTNGIAFAVGSYTTFLSIKVFCYYTGLAVLFCYINTITFLAACMVFSGRREARNLHAMVPCKKATPKDCVQDRSRGYKIFCTGGDADMEDPAKLKMLLEQEENREDIPWFSNFLSDKYAPFLMKTPVRIIVIYLYFVYIGLSLWGCATLQEGLELEKLAPDNSYLIPYYGNYSKYFRAEYGPGVMIVIHEPLDYYQPEVRTNVHNIIQSFVDSEFYLDELQFSQSWLRDFESFLNSHVNNQPVDMTSFISILREQFLVLPPFEKYKVDLNFSADFSQIQGSRFLVPSRGLIDEKELLLESREMSENSVYETISYHGAFIFYDQYIVIVSNTVRNLGMAAACMLIVSIFLLPHPLAVMWVTLSVISICIGVVGFMVFWDVNLDSISMINLILCIGFSVDFSGHICYHFTTCKETNPLDKIKTTMKFLGLPIWQGAISTVLGVIVLAGSDSYIFRTFFKLIFLVVVFGFLHAMVVLPVILPTIGPGCCTQRSASTRNEQPQNGYGPNHTAKSEMVNLKSNPANV